MSFAREGESAAGRITRPLRKTVIRRKAIMTNAVGKKDGDRLIAPGSMLLNGDMPALLPAPNGGSTGGAAAQIESKSTKSDDEASFLRDETVAADVDDDEIPI
jgi:hypothetical protein